LDYENHTGSKENITYLEKPDWVKARANQATISGVPPATPRTDTLVAVISAAGKSDTLKLTIVTSVPPIHAGDGKDK
jgi:Flp pilus assembly CpaE family ATPase